MKKIIATRIEQKDKEKFEKLAEANGLASSALLRLIIVGVTKKKSSVVKKLLSNE